MDSKKVSPRISAGHRPPVFKDRLTAAELIAVGAACFFASLICAVIQTGFFSVVRPFGCAPDVCLALSVAVGLKFGSKCGGVVGLMSGFTVDALSASGFSLAIPIYVVFGIVMGMLSDIESGTDLPHIVIYIIGLFCGALVLAAASILGMLVSYTSLGFADMLTRSVLPRLLLNMLAGLALYPCVLLTAKLIRKKQGFK